MAEKMAAQEAILPKPKVDVRQDEARRRDVPPAVKTKTNNASHRPKAAEKIIPAPPSEKHRSALAVKKVLPAKKLPIVVKRAPLVGVKPIQETVFQAREVAAEVELQLPDISSQPTPDLVKLFDPRIFEYPETTGLTVEPDVLELEVAEEGLSEQSVVYDPGKSLLEDATLLRQLAVLQAENQPESPVLPEADFSEEVMGTYYELVSLMAVDREVGPEFRAEYTENTEVNAFEALVAESAPDSIPSNIEAIVEQANEQSLEETFVQISLVLAEEKSEIMNYPEIEQAIKDVVESLAVDGVETQSEDPKIIITPELTQKLLTLLRVMGYEDPKRVLIEFISEHGLIFLIQAIRYLYSLADDRPEFAPVSNLASVSLLTAGSLSARLGKTMLRGLFIQRAMAVG